MIEHRGVWRGKRVDNGEWVKGYLIRMWRKYHLQDLENENLVVEVDPSTLGECAGRVGNSGKLFFEGDIVKYKGKNFVIKYLEKYMRFSPTKPGTVFAVFDYSQSEIIGNIHDNPGLMESEGGNDTGS